MAYVYFLTAFNQIYSLFPRWFGISLTYIRFYHGYRAQGRDRRDLPYTSRFQPYAAWYSLVMSLLISIVSHDELCRLV
jgi:amino acid permease